MPVINNGQFALNNARCVTKENSWCNYSITHNNNLPQYNSIDHAEPSIYPIVVDQDAHTQAYTTDNRSCNILNSIIHLKKTYTEHD